MDVFSIELSMPEIQTIRQSLDVINIAGKDARFLASLQIKLENELEQITNMLVAQQNKQTEKKTR